MTHRVGGDSLPQLRGLGCSPDSSPCALARERAAPGVEEERGGPPASRSQGGTSAYPVGFHGLDRERTNGHDPFLAAFAEQAYDWHIPVEVEVVRAQAHGF